ncbi:GNAT family N-acetyltransferase [Pseudonocardia sp. C8]|uniref:GNAT family N-acetyltransferase n=1 Tax=Pseudonocardia sp. C8 TaxID=2762759 RepID=UPI001642A68A|nr:GNAT family N-acetyltransferase [Pseudonocardia sp. C8]MBC3192396.1 GNAT family N-acetyltransferase [Pseudonocardia sp. C8]
MSDVLTHAERPIPAQAVRALYRAPGWWPDRTDHQIGRALVGGGPAVGAWHDDELVGFARAVSDGVLRAYVEDVVVTPRLRGAGIGTALVHRLLEQLADIPTVTLFCPRSLAPFYGRLGFRATGQAVMHLSR